MHDMFKPFFSAAKTCAVGLLVITGSSPAAAQPATTSSNAQEAGGWNVIRVGYDGGIFQQTAAGQWTEFVNDGRTFSFAELNRDDGSAYLYDASRDVRLQIDVDRQMILSAVRSEPLQNLYQITDATAGAVSGDQGAFGGINGHNLIHAFYDGGVFASADQGEWFEEVDDGRVFEFVEVQRDGWAVYLYDPSRDVRIQLDVHGQRILSAVGNEPWGVLYTMTRARIPE